jgi:flagellar motility protein MotE (MotC chaperone)
VIPALPRSGVFQPVYPKEPTVRSVQRPKASTGRVDDDEAEYDDFESGPVKKPKRRSQRSKISIPDREEPVERKNIWGQERYAAVVPPTMSLSSLQQELNKDSRKPIEKVSHPGSGSERERLEQLSAEIEKAREALRQETARLEAMLKAAGNCGGSMGMLMGDPLSSSATVSPASLREAPNEQIDAVSKTLKGMKPEQAAAVIARLDRGLAAEVLRRMRPADAGSVMGLIKPELAADLATEIALRKPTPSAKDKKGAGK